MRLGAQAAYQGLTLESRPDVGRVRVMLRAVVVADTHIPDFAKGLPGELFRPLATADMILHAGDVTSPQLLDELGDFAPVVVALGNGDGNDIRAWGAKEEVTLELEAVRVAMVHDSGPKRGRADRLRRRFPEANLIVFGDSHIPVDEQAEGIRLFNPRSPTWKRRQPGPTYGLLVIEGQKCRSRIIPLP